jgi:hypothetical protein
MLCKQLLRAYSRPYFTFKPFTFLDTAMEIQVGDIGHMIQLSVAPVFLLTGVGTNLMVLTNRLGRITDRSRVLEDKLRTTDPVHHADLNAELITLYPRAHLINRAIVLSTACALMVSMVIISLFVGDALTVELSKFIAIFFILAMLCLVSSFVMLLREILSATNSLYERRIEPIARPD